MDCYDFVPKVDHPAQIISGATATLGLRCLFTSEDYDCHGLSKEVRTGLIFWARTAARRVAGFNILLKASLPVAWSSMTVRDSENLNH